MVNLRCPLCGCEWAPSVISYWLCPACEIAAAEPIVTNFSIEDIDQLIAHLKSHLIYPPQKDGHSSVSLICHSKEAFLNTIDAAVLLYDEVCVPESVTLELFSRKDQKFTYYYDACIILPLEDCYAGIFEEELQKSIYFSQGTTLRGLWNLEQMVACMEVRTVSYRKDVMAEVLSGLQITPPRNLTAQEDEFMRVVRVLSGQFVVSSFAHRPMAFCQDSEYYFNSRLRDLTSLESKKVLGLWKFADGIGIHLPRNARAPEVIKFREGQAGENFRAVITRALTRGSLPLASELRLEFADQVRRVDEEMSRMTNVASALLTGSMATAGALLEGVTGAIIGGIAGNLFGAGSAALLEWIFRRVQPDWSHFLVKWRDRK